MRTKPLFFVTLFSVVFYSCEKSLEVSRLPLHTGKVLAKTCPAEPNTTEVAVQLDNKDPLSFQWKNPFNDSVYNNVIITFNPTLVRSVGKSLTYLSVRKPNSTDTLGDVVPDICIDYPIAYLDSIAVK